jgi:hypothetical protein
VLFLGLIQFSTPDLADNDGYYHIKLAYLMRTEGLKPAFPWLPLSILNPREFYDHHFLYHVALIPFTFGDLLAGAKWSAVFFASLAFLSTWNLFRNQQIPHASLWALGLAAISETFLFRMSVPRAQSLSVAVVMLGMDWLLRKKYLRLGGLAFAYVWLYDAFPLLGVVAFMYVAAGYLSERRVELRPLVAVGAGTILGLLINPYFPYNIAFAVQHILPKLVDATEIQVGNEWYPYDTDQLLSNSTLALVAFVSGGLALGLSGKRVDTRTAFAFLLACLFGVALLQARRFIEYFAPLALVFGAFAWTPVIARAITARGWQKHLPGLALLGLIVPFAWVSFTGVQARMDSAKPFDMFAGSSAWLAANTTAGERVFQTDWDDFPRLFFYNSANTYLIGLDPTYMQLYNAELYDLWVKVVQGRVDNPSEIILAVFDARYVVSDLRHAGFLEEAAQDPGLVEVYRDETSVVFAVRSPAE